MKKDLIFKGTATALITPFKNGKIDYESLSKIIEMQIGSGINALVVAGTTAEASTLSDEERYELYRFSSHLIKKRVPLIVGCGTNSTSSSIRHAKEAEASGADALLVITPYYNKGTENGIYNHYISISNSTNLPTILYNVPSRTSVNLSLELTKQLAEHERIYGIKEADLSADRLIRLSALGEKLALYSGNDAETYTFLSLGGMGVISVTSNIIPKEMRSITDSFFAGDIKASLKIQQKLLPFIDSMFIETNPSCIKYAMSRAGYCSDEMRLPLTPPTETTKNIIDKMLEGIL